MIDLGSRMLEIDNCNKSTVKVLANIANKWLKELEEKGTHAQSVVQSVPGSDLFRKIELIHKLFEMGGLSEAEFADAKERVFSSDAYRTEKDKLLASL